jgi:hypothetical protein
MSTILTNFTNEVLESNISDKNDTVDNNIFLQAIFGQSLNNVYPIIVSFSGNPQNVQPKAWYGHHWTGDLRILPQNNNYFSLSVYRANDSGQYRRRKSQFHALYAVMLDDIGSKIPIERLTLEPSWLLETSSGNFQAGYILDEPIRDSKLADQLMYGIVSAGLCDPGANGPTARLARLPVAMNGKHEPSFQCQLKSWSPDNRYSIQELIDGLQLEIVEKKRTKRDYNKTEDASNADSEQIWTPRPEENAVLSALRNHDLYKSPLGEGKHDITCPWVNEHTALVNSGTAYFEPDDNYPIGGFKCQHGHCSERNVRDLLDLLNVDIKSARMKPTIRVIKGEIHRIVDIAEQELAATHQYYQRGGIIVSVYTDKSTKQTLIQAVSQPALVRALSGVATWEQFDGRTKDWVRIDPPARHAIILYDSNSYRHLPIINGLARQPYLRPDGSLMKLAGYDLDTGMFGVFDSRQFLIPDKPTREDAELALKVLTALLEEFCFATDKDRAAALSAMLTAAIRPSLVNAPMIHVRAHAVGSGKSYWCSLITTFASPQQGTPTTFPADEECRKLLLAELLRAPAVIEFDNLTIDILPHKSLCTSLTSEFIAGRILGGIKNCNSKYANTFFI